MDFDLVVVGGGVIGLGLARDAAGRGLRTAVVDAGPLGQEASRAAAGMLSPVGEDLDPRSFLDLGLRSLALYPGLAAELAAETGIDCGFRTCGKLEVAFSPDEMTELEALAARHQGVNGGVELLDARATAQRLPWCGERVRGGAWIPGDCVVDNRELARALVASCEIRGVRLFAGTRATALRSSAGRTTGLDLADGPPIAARRVLLAAGAWSGALEGLPRTIPVRPVRGEMLALDVPPPLGAVVATHRAYLVPRPDHLIVGATSEERGFDRTHSAGGLAQLLSGVLEVFPHLSGAGIREQWVGFRPGTPDDLPILGSDPELEGLVYATGHFRNGILLTPATAELLGPVLVGDPEPEALRPFRPERFLD
jgi:glycine oxidase